MYIHQHVIESDERYGAPIEDEILNNIFLYYHLPTGERNPSPRFFPFFSFFIFMHFYANPVFLPIPPV